MHDFAALVFDRLGTVVFILFFCRRVVCVLVRWFFFGFSGGGGCKSVSVLALLVCRRSEMRAAARCYGFFVGRVRGSRGGGWGRCESDGVGTVDVFGIFLGGWGYGLLFGLGVGMVGENGRLSV